MATPPSEPAGNWLRLAVGGGAALFLGMGLGRFSYSPLIPALIAEGQLTGAEAGYVGAGNLAGFLVGALVQPYLRSVMGERRTLNVGLLTAFTCLAASIVALPAPWAFPWLAFWRGLVGLAVGVIMVQALAVVTRAAPPEKLGVASGIVFTGVGAAILLTGIGVPRLLEIGLSGAWGGLAAIGAVAAAVGLWGFAASIPGAGTGPAVTVDDAPPINPSAANRLAAAQTMFSIGLIPHTIFWVDFIVRGLGHDIGMGGLHWALFGLGALTGTTFWGWLADRIGFRAGLVLVFTSLAAGLILPVFNSAGWALVISSLVVGAQPGCSALLSGRTQQLFGGAGMPRVWRRMTLAGGVGQGIAGYIMVAVFDATGSYAAMFLISGAAFSAGAIVSASIKQP